MIGQIAKSILTIFVFSSLFVSVCASADDSRGAICKFLLAGGESSVDEWRQLEQGAVRAGDGVSAPALNMKDQSGEQFLSPFGRQVFHSGELTKVGYHLIGRDIEFEVQGVTYRAVVIKENDPGFKRITVRAYAKREKQDPDQPMLPLASEPEPPSEDGPWQWITLSEQDDWVLPLADLKQKSQVPRYVSAEERRSLDIFFRANRTNVEPSEPIRRTSLAERMYLYRGETVEEGKEIAELNRRISYIIKMAEQGTSLQEFEQDRRIMDLQNALLRGDYQGVAARVRSSILETWRVTHKLRDDLAAIAAKGYTRDEALQIVKKFEEYEGIPEQFRASEFFPNLKDDEKELNEMMVLFSKFFGHQKQLGEMIQAYDMVWAIFNRLLNDSSIPMQARGDLEKALEEARFGFEAVPPTHREILYHAQTHVVEEARLNKNKQREATRRRQSVFDRVRSSLQTVDPKLLPLPKYTRGAWAFFTREMLNELHHNILRSEIIFMRLTAGNLGNYGSELALAADTTILPDEQPKDGEANFIDPGEKFKLRAMDYYLFDMLYDRVGVFGTVDPLVAFYRLADSDRVLNDLRVRFDELAKGRSKAVQDNIKAAKEIAGGMAPLSMSYEHRQGFWTANRVGWTMVIGGSVGVSAAAAYYGIWDVSASWDATTNFLGDLPDNSAYMWQWVESQFIAEGFDPEAVNRAILETQGDLADDGKINCSNSIDPFCMD
ncbi:MAG: hypothetical protein HRT45_14885 [Bdellovibrionales bacterium]|nr:hypothetical protein [Bdellovibrionales bacterium]